VRKEKTGSGSQRRVVKTCAEVGKEKVRTVFVLSRQIKKKNKTLPGKKGVQEVKPTREASVPGI